MSKHPQLRAEHLAEGVAYMTAYARLERGWSFERACNEPPRKKRPTRTLEERHAFYAANRDRVAKLRLTPRAERANVRERKRYTPHTTEDNSPPHIREIRTAFCDEFVKTGVINVELQAQLKGYADGCRAAKEHPERVPPEHADRRFGRPKARVGDDGAGGQPEIDSRTAKLIGQFLRS